MRPVALAPDVAVLPLTPTRSRLRQLDNGQIELASSVSSTGYVIFQVLNGQKATKVRNGDTVFPGNTVPRKTSGTRSLDMPGSGQRMCRRSGHPSNDCAKAVPGPRGHGTCLTIQFSMP